jgi:hypothetical protein
MEEGIGVCPLAHNILGVKKVCWNFGVGTKTSDKQVNYSFGPTQTKQQVG